MVNFNYKLKTTIMPTINMPTFIPKTRLNQWYTCYVPYVAKNLIRASKYRIYKMAGKNEFGFTLVPKEKNPTRNEDIFIPATEFASHFVPTNCK